MDIVRMYPSKNGFTSELLRYHFNFSLPVIVCSFKCKQKPGGTFVPYHVICQNEYILISIIHFDASLRAGNT